MSHVGSPAQRAASVRAAGRARETLIRRSRQRQQEFERLRGRGFAVWQAAHQMHVSVRTAQRYEARRSDRRATA